MPFQVSRGVRHRGGFESAGVTAFLPGQMRRVQGSHHGVADTQTSRQSSQCGRYADFKAVITVW